MLTIVILTHSPPNSFYLEKNISKFNKKIMTFLKSRTVKDFKVLGKGKKNGSIIEFLGRKIFGSRHQNPKLMDFKKK